MTANDADSELTLAERFRDLYLLASEASELRAKLQRRGSASPIDDYETFQKGRYARASLDAERAEAAATEEERRHPLFEAAVDEFWPQALAAYAMESMSLDRPLIKALIKIHEAESRDFEGFSRVRQPRVVFGFILTVTAFFASQVPKEVFEYFDSDHYAGYRALTLVVTIFAIAFLAGVYFFGLPAVSGRSDPRRVAADFATTRVLLDYLDAAAESAPTGSADASKVQTGG